MPFELCLKEEIGICRAERVKREDIPHVKAQRHEGIQHIQETLRSSWLECWRTVCYEAGEVTWG